MRPSGVKFLKINKKKIHLSYNTLQTKMYNHIKYLKKVYAVQFLRVHSMVA